MAIPPFRKGQILTADELNELAATLAASVSMWRNGSGVPSDSLGTDGDYYLDNDTTFVYTRVGGVYVHISTLSGGGNWTAPPVSSISTDFTIDEGSLSIWGISRPNVAEGTGSDVWVSAAASFNGNGGEAGIASGDGSGEGNKGGDLYLTIGAGSSGATNGLFYIQNLGTVDPATTDAIWSDSGVLVQSGHTAAKASTGDAVERTTGIMVPFYVYPGNMRDLTDVSDGAVAARRLVSLIRQYHDVPVIVVVNQAGPSGTGGPGPYDGNIEALIVLLRAAGAQVCGYVDTTYGARDDADVLSEIALWRSLYPNALCDGIFFDQMQYAPGNTSDGGVTYDDNVNVEKYASYYTACKAAGYSLVIGNPGGDERHEWYETKVADIICIAESDSWPSVDLVAGKWTDVFAGVDGHSDFPYRVNAVLVHTTPSFDTALFNGVKSYIGWIYVTDGLFSGGASNPWGVLSSYVEDIFVACASGGNWTAGPVSVVSANNLAINEGTLDVVAVILPDAVAGSDTGGLDLNLSAGHADLSGDSTIGSGGNLLFRSGYGASAINTGGGLISFISGGGGGGDFDGSGGNIEFTAFSGSGAGNFGGNISFEVGVGTGGATSGSLLISNLPTTDPVIDNAWWNDNGVLVQSGHTAPVDTNIWNAGTVSAIGNGLTINSGTISADKQGTIAATSTGTIIPVGLQSCIVNVGTVNTTLAITPGYQGQHLRLEIKQGATAHLVALGATFAFSADIPSFTATASANARDLIQAICLNGTVWGVAAINKGFTV